MTLWTANPTSMTFYVNQRILVPVDRKLHPTREKLSASIVLFTLFNDLHDV